MILEICVDSIQSALNAVAGGANRIELCSSLAEGGLTPTPAFLKVVKECIKTSHIPVFCMVRPRGGPMQYSEYEREVILGDIKDLKAAGADGLVFGALSNEGNVDIGICEDVIKAADGLPCTFHRAFDISLNPMDQLETIISLGFKRILTSGCKKNAIEGASFIKRLNERANGRIEILAGAGVTSSNCEDLIKSTGVKEIHCSAKVKQMSSPFVTAEVKMGSTDDAFVYLASTDEVRLIKEVLKMII